MKNSNTKRSISSQQRSTQRHVSKTAPTGTKLIPKMLFLAGFATLLSVSACNSDLDDDLTSATDPESEAAKVAEDIENSYARLAAKHADICPKLIQKNVDEETIVRSAEVMVYDFCEYYLYPEKGQNLMVTLDSDQIETLLIVPTIHNFANGSYHVTSYDKHTIRLRYVGAAHKPQRLSYDVAITITD